MLLTTTTSPPTSRLRTRLGAALLAAATLALPACGSSADDDGEVASLAGSTSDESATAAPTGDLEQELLDYVACLRDQGLDVPDPQVDADGNVQLGPGGGGGPGAGGEPPAQVDADALEAATEVCGDPPEGALAGVGGDSAELQDAALAFAQCMRDNGVDVPDPQAGGAGAGGPVMLELDTDDPEVQAALEACQDALPAPGSGDGADAGTSSS